MTAFKTYTKMAVLLLAVTACTKNGRTDFHKEPNVELIQDMMEQPALKAQDFMPSDRDKASSLVPPENTVPVGYKPYPYHLDPVTAAKNLKNPHAGDMSAEILKTGRTKFETYCAVCHGYEGKGDGPVSVKMALKPPPLISEKIITANDGAIFHIISDGQGVMSSYAYQLVDIISDGQGVMSSYAYQLVDENDRWAIVNYVRSLQRLAKGGSAANEPVNAGSAVAGAEKHAHTKKN